MLLANGICGGCQAPIHWAKTVGARGAEKAFPANITPEREGNVTVTGGIATVLTKGQAAGAREHGVPLYTSHFSTCPKAADFRRAAASRNNRLGGTNARRR